MRGWLVVDKPAGLTSHDVVARLRRLLKEKRIGHSGTLDPDATGVLLIAIGHATRLMNYLPGEKAYRALIRLGMTTSTLDASGEILEEKPVTVTRADIEAQLPHFTGAIWQQPPMVSAVFHQGKRLYELARQGIEIPDRPKREVTIHALSLQSLSLPDFELDVHCSSGTYIRTLADDLGRALGCGAHLRELRRTEANGVGIEQAIALDDLTPEDARSRILPPDAPLGHLHRVDLSEEEAISIGHGRSLATTEVDPQAPVRLHAPDGVLLAIAEWRENHWHPVVVLPNLISER